MKATKILVCLVLVLAMVLSIVACGDEAKETEAKETGTEAPATEPETKAPETKAPETEPETQPHFHKYKTEIKNATCTEDGLKTMTCECGDVKTETIPALGHTPDNGVVTTPATVDAEGVLTYTCFDCGEVVKTEAIPKLEKITTVSRALVTFDDTIEDNPTKYQEYVYEKTGLFIGNMHNSSLNQDTIGASQIYRMNIGNGRFQNSGGGQLSITKTYRTKEEGNTYFQGKDATFDKNDQIFRELYTPGLKFTVSFDFIITAAGKTGTWLYFEKNGCYPQDESRRINFIASSNGVLQLLGTDTGITQAAWQTVKVGFTFDTTAMTITASADGQEIATVSYADVRDGDTPRFIFNCDTWAIDNYEVK